MVDAIGSERVRAKKEEEQKERERSKQRRAPSVQATTGTAPETQSIEIAPTFVFDHFWERQEQ